MLEQRGGVDGHRVSVSSEVMGGREFPFLRETRKYKALSVARTELLAFRKRERAFGKLQGSAVIRKQASVCRGFWLLNVLSSLP